MYASWLLTQSLGATTQVRLTWIGSEVCVVCCIWVERDIAQVWGGVLLHLGCCSHHCGRHGMARVGLTQAASRPQLAGWTCSCAPVLIHPPCVPVLPLSRLLSYKSHPSHSPTTTSTTTFIPLSPPLQIVPADLNAFLFQLESNIAWAAGQLMESASSSSNSSNTSGSSGNTSGSSGQQQQQQVSLSAEELGDIQRRFSAAATARQSSMNKLLWDNEAGGCGGGL